MPLWNWGKDNKNVSIQQNRIQHSKVPYKNKQLKKKNPAKCKCNDCGF